MASPSGIPPLTHSKTCDRCGRIGTHAFRVNADGLHECTSVGSCRTRSRRNAGLHQDGRGRLPRYRAPWDGGGLGVAYVIGPECPARDTIERTLRRGTDLAVVISPADRLTLAALGSRNVKLIAMDAACLGSVGFRNELSLRRRQPRLGRVPILVYGGRSGAEVPATQPLVAGSTPRAVERLRNLMRSFEVHELDAG
jgi:hypothetical protein